jgi:energy-coupling factor transporter transmembrane protein EcfT
MWNKMQNMFKKSIENKLKFNLIKSIIWGLAIPVFVMWMWFSLKGNPLNEYRLIKQGVKTTGKIYEVKEVVNIDEKYNDRQASVNYEYDYKFSFNLSNGDTIFGSGKEGGYIPNEFENVDINPVGVPVEYLAENPNVNRVSNMFKSNKTIYEWFRYRILMALIIFLVTSYFGIVIINNGLKEYRQGVKELV